MTEDMFSVLTNPKLVSRLEVCDGLEFQFVKPKPNAFWRLWQYLLLGWKWSDVDD